MRSSRFCGSRSAGFQPSLSPCTPSNVGRHQLFCRAAKGFGPAKTKPSEKCPCGAKKLYQDCCQPYHDGSADAPTPEAILRARFSGLIKGKNDFVISTFHPDYHKYHYNTEPGAAQAQLERDVAAGSSVMDYEGLQVLKVEPGANEDEGYVMYGYKYSKKRGWDQNMDGSRHWDQNMERSRFVRVDGRWLFVDYQQVSVSPEAAASAQQKQV